MGDSSTLAPTEVNHLKGKEEKRPMDGRPGRKICTDRKKIYGRKVTRVETYVRTGGGICGRTDTRVETYGRTGDEIYVCKDARVEIYVRTGGEIYRRTDARVRDSCTDGRGNIRTDGFPGRNMYTYGRDWKYSDARTPG